LFANEVAFFVIGTERNGDDEFCTLVVDIDDLVLAEMDDIGQWGREGLVIGPLFLAIVITDE
jgi:hypothetical protein